MMLLSHWRIKFARIFLSCKAGEENGLPPADDENAAGREMHREDVRSSMREQKRGDPGRLIPQSKASG
jgi:hypothetical protein